MYPTSTTTNYYISKFSYASSILSSSSYNMENKINIGISLEKAYSKVGSKFAYMIGEYQFSTNSADL